MPELVDKKRWDKCWLSLEQDRKLFSRLARLTRRMIFQPAVKYYTDRYFPVRGAFVEMGCGTAESSIRIDRRSRTLFGLDYSNVALRSAGRLHCFTGLIQGDIFALPCKSGSLDGIWNLGVMEHFSEVQLVDCLREFRRVLKSDGIILLFWPPEWNASRWVLGPIERIVKVFSRKPFTFFPGEVSRLRSINQARTLLEANGFQPIALEFSWRTAFIHVVVVARCRWPKPSAC